MSFHNPLSLIPQKAVPQAQRSIAAASIGGSYTLVGTIFTTNVVLLIIVSTLDQHVQISLDGVNDFMPVLSGSAIVLDFKSDGAPLSGNYGVYVKEIGNPTTGNLYVSVVSV